MRIWDDRLEEAGNVFLEVFQKTSQQHTRKESKTVLEVGLYVFKSLF